MPELQPIGGRRPSYVPHDTNAHNRQQLYILADGRELSSREVNWLEVPLKEVVEVQFHIRNERVGLQKRNLPQDLFREFVVFRTGGIKHQRYPKGDGTFVMLPYQFQSWTLGWTDGETEFLDEFAVKDGRHLRRYTCPRDYVATPSHWHHESERIVVTSRIPEVRG